MWFFLSVFNLNWFGRFWLISCVFDNWNNQPCNCNKLGFWRKKVEKFGVLLLIPLMKCETRFGLSKIFEYLCGFFLSVFNLKWFGRFWLISCVFDNWNSQGCNCNMLVFFFFLSCKIWCSFVDLVNENAKTWFGLSKFFECLCGLF